MAWLNIKGLSKIERDTFIVSDINLLQESQQKIAIAGSTGSGKTTLLKMIAGLVQPSSGEIFFKDKKVLGPVEKLLPGHKSIAYLSQHFELRNNYYVYELLEMANKIEQSEADKIYRICKIEHLLKRRTNELSGGEKQRIVLAKKLTTAPELLLLDEPFSNLDTVHKNIIKQVIAAIGEQLKITCMMISHDPSDILAWADWIMIMQEGKLIQQGSSKEVYKKPINEYVAGLLGEYNLIDQSVTTGFSNFENIIQNNKKLLLRPEQISIAAATNIAQQDMVKQVTFRGSDYMVDVQVGNQVIKVKTLSDQFSVGNRVFLSVNTIDAWYI
jgi:iron(III) transport system ATP-binding protein